jgi:hypothetical protein
MCGDRPRSFVKAVPFNVNDSKRGIHGRSFV